MGIGNVESPLGQDCFNVRYGRTGLVSNPLDRPKMGLPWITTEDGNYFILMPDEERMYRSLRRTVEGRKEDPSMLCFLMKAEARIPMYRGEERVRLNNLEELSKIGKFVKKIDPNRLTSVHIDHSHYLHSYAKVADIIEVAYKTSSFAPRIIPKLSLSAWKPSGLATKFFTSARVAESISALAIGTQGAASWKILWALA